MSTSESESQYQEGKVTSVQCVGQTPRTSRVPEEANPKDAKENRRATRARERTLRNTGDQAAGAQHQPVPALASSLDKASFEKLGSTPHFDAEGWLTCPYDTDATIWAFPQGAKMGTETEANGANYKTTSGELIPDHGGLCVQGTTECGHGADFPSRKADVHKTPDQSKQSPH